jgi:hypothetical protein
MTLGMLLGDGVDVHDRIFPFFNFFESVNIVIIVVIFDWILMSLSSKDGDRIGRRSLLMNTFVMMYFQWFCCCTYLNIFKFA